MKRIEWNATRAFWATWRTGGGVRVNVSVHEGLAPGLWRVEVWAGDRAGIGPALIGKAGGLREAKRVAVELGRRAEDNLHKARGGQ